MAIRAFRVAHVCIGRRKGGREKGGDLVRVEEGLKEVEGGQRRILKKWCIPWNWKDAPHSQNT